MEPRPLDKTDLQRKLDEASAAYKKAMAEYKRLMAVSTDTTHLQDPALVDGNLALRQAMHIHRQARLRYEAALRQFTDSRSSGRGSMTNEGTRQQSDLLSVALRVLACFTDMPPRTPLCGEVQCLLDTASPDEADLPVDELAVAIINRERKRHATRV